MSGRETTAHPAATGEALRRELVERCLAWCEATGTRRTILAWALTGRSYFLSQPVAMTLDVFARCHAGLDLLDRMEEMAGPLDRPSRAGCGAAAEAAKEALRARINRVAARLDAPAELLALAVSHSSTLLRPRGGVSDAQFATYQARLDAIEAALDRPSNGEAHGPQAEAGTAPAGHRDEGTAVHPAD